MRSAPRIKLRAKNTLALGGLIVLMVSPLHAQNLFASSANKIFQIDPGGSVSLFASGLREPEGLAFDNQGNLFVANFNTGTIAKITPSGLTSIFSSGLKNPNGLAFSSQGNLFVTTNGDNSIEEITPDGTVTVFYTDNGTRLKNPSGLVFDAQGNLYVGSDHNVLRITPNGVSSLYGSVPSPEGMAFDSHGNLFVANLGGGVEEIVPPGIPHQFYSGPGLDDPFGLAIDGQDNVYVASYLDNQILKITPQGVASAFATGLSRPTFLAFAPPPPPALASLTFVSPVAGGTVLTATVTLSGVSPSDTVVGLSSSDPVTVRVFRSVLILAGSSSATFAINTFRSHTTKTVTLQATLGQVVQTRDLTITGR